MRNWCRSPQLQRRAGQPVTKTTRSRPAIYAADTADAAKLVDWQRQGQGACRLAIITATTTRTRSWAADDNDDDNDDNDEEPAGDDDKELAGRR